MHARMNLYGGRPEASNGDEPEPHSRTTQRREAILLLEDNDDLRFLCAEVLRGAGYEVLECRNLEAAFVAVEGRVPDILLLDRELPDGSGLDLARWVRRRSSLDGIRVIAFSARTSPEDVAAAFAAGCDAFVGKPCGPLRLITRIAATAAKSALTSRIGAESGRFALGRSARRRSR